METHDTAAQAFPAQIKPVNDGDDLQQLSRSSGRSSSANDAGKQGYTLAPELARFPSDARLLLTLTVAVLVPIGLFLGNLRSLSDFEVYQACQDLAWNEVVHVITMEENLRWVGIYEACIAPTARRSALYTLQGLVFIVTSISIYNAAASWRIRRRGQQPLPVSAGADQVRNAVAQLSTEAGLSRAPDLYFDPRPTFPAAAFGVSSKPILALGQSTLVDLANDRPRFEAVVRHELAHIRFRDLGQFYVAQSLFRGMLISTGILFAYLLGGLAFIAGVAWSVIVLGIQYGLLVLVGFALLRDHLRKREFFADLYAADRPGGANALRSALLASGSRRRRLPRMLRTHPSPRERLEVLDRPYAALRFKPWTAFLAGTAVGVLVPTLDWFIGQLASGTEAGRRSAPIAGAIGGILLGRMLATGIWRNVHIGILVRKRLDRGLVLGLSAAAGLFAGGLLALHLTLAASGTAIPITGPTVLLVPVTVVALCTWISGCAVLRLRTSAAALDGRAYGVGRRATTLVAAALFGAVYILATMLRSNQFLRRDDTSDGLPTVSAEYRPTDLDITWAFLARVGHHWLTYATIALIATTLLHCYWRGQKTASTELLPRPTPHPHPRPVAPAHAKQPSTEPGEEVSRSAVRASVVWCSSIFVVLALVLTTGVQPRLLPLGTVAVVSLILAWRLDRGWRTPPAQLLAAYGVTAVAVGLFCIVIEQIRPLVFAVLAVVVVHLAATFRLVPTNRHLTAILVAGLLLARPLEAGGAAVGRMLAWVVFGGIAAVILLLTQEKSSGRGNAPLELALALGGVAAMTVGAIGVAWL